MLKVCMSVCVTVMAMLMPVKPQCPCEDPKWCEPIKTLPEKEIFAFAPKMSVENLMKYNWTVLTTIVVSHTVDNRILCMAHKNGVRVVPLTDFGKVGMLPNATAREIWINQTVDLVQAKYFDGVNFDLEAPISPSQARTREGYIALVNETTNRLKKLNPYAQISVDVPHGPNVYGRFYGYVALAKSCDFLCIMDYDEWSNPYRAGANMPYGLSKIGIIDYLSLAGVTPSKLVVAVPWYGYDFVCKNISSSNVCTAVVDEDLYELYQEQGFVKSSFLKRQQVKYFEIVKLLANSTSGRMFDPTTVSPYFNYMNSQTKTYHQLWYDDPQSITAKCGFVSEYNLRGIGMWQVDCLDYSDTPAALKQREDMWTALTCFLQK